MQQNHKFDIFHSVDSICYTFGGISVSVVSLLKSLSNVSSNYNLILFANPGKNPILNKNTSHLNFKWHTTSPNLAVGLWSLLSPSIEKAFNYKSNLPALIHDHGIWLPQNHITAAIARRYRIPRIVTIHGMLEPWALKHRAWKKCIAWHLFQFYDLKTATVIHATSEREGRTIKRILPHVPVIVIPLGVDAPKLLASTPKNTSLKRALFLGRIHPVKGLVNLIEAWRRINCNDWTLVLAGNDDSRYASTVQDNIEKYNLSSNIEWIGAVTGERKWTLYRESDLFILPSLSENFGIVVAEALACGIPVITTKATPWYNLVTHQCGWWVDIGVDPLVEALREAMSLSPQERQVMGDRGRKLIETHYTWEQTARKFSEVYQGILAKKPIPYTMEYRP